MATLIPIGGRFQQALHDDLTQRRWRPGVYHVRRGGHFVYVLVTYGVRIGSVERRDDQVQVTGTGAVLALVAATLVERGIVPADLRSDPLSLEAAYLSLTGRTAAEFDA